MKDTRPLQYFVRVLIARSNFDDSIDYSDALDTAGYCLDRPEIAPAGSTMGVNVGREVPCERLAGI